MAAVWRDTGPRQSQPRGGNLSFVYLGLGHYHRVAGAGNGKYVKYVQIKSEGYLYGHTC